MLSKHVFVLVICLHTSFTWLPVKAYIRKPFEIHDLTSNDLTEFSNETGAWMAYGNTSSQLYSVCAGTPLLGGNLMISSGGWFKRSYTNVPSHASVLITMTFWLIDDWSLSDGIVLMISNNTFTHFNREVLKLAYDQTTWSGSLCGDTDIRDLKPIKVYITSPHYGKELKLRVLSSNSNSREAKQFGVRDIKILFSNSSFSSSRCSLTDPVSINTFHNCNCTEGKYSANGICLDSHTSCGKALTYGSEACLNCKDDYIYDGKYCIQCHSACKTCFGFKENQCLTCPTGKYLYQNSSCLGSCNFPFHTVVATNGEPLCLPTCGNNNYLYPNGSCSASCSFAYNPTLIDSQNVCAPICDSNTFINPDKSCSVQCEAPMISYEEAGVKYCQLLIEENWFYYTEEKVSKPICPYPFVSTNLTFYQTCSRPSDDPFSLISVPAVIVASLGAFIISATLLGESWGIIVTILARMLQFIKFIAISYGDQTGKVLATWDLSFISLDIGIRLPEKMQEESSVENLPPFFAVHQTNSEFLSNAWGSIILTGITISILLFFLICELVLTKIKRRSRVLLWTRRFRISAQNFFLIVSYANFGNFLFFAALGLKYSSLQSKLSVISFILSILFILISLFSLVPNIIFLRRQENLRKRDKDVFDLQKKYPGFQVLFKNFHNKTLYQEGFLLFLLLRDILYMLVIPLAIKYPLYQIAFITVMNFTMIAYIFSSEPYKAFIDKAQHLIYEAILFATNLCALVASVLDDADEYGNITAYLGKAIMYMNIGFPFVVLFFLGVKILKPLIGAYNHLIIKKANIMVPSSEESQFGLSLDKSFTKDTIENSLSISPKKRLPKSMFSNMESKKDVNTVSKILRKENSKDKGPNNSSSNFQLRIPLQMNRLRSGLKTKNIILRGVQLSSQTVSKESNINTIQLSSSNPQEIDLFCKEREIIMKSNKNELVQSNDVNRFGINRLIPRVPFKK